MINWNVSKKDHDLIVAIAKRAMATLTDGQEYEQRTCIMDLTACHANGMELDLQGLLSAPPLDFAHDVFGIARHINRSTGKIENCFVPRTAYANHRQTVAA